MRHGTHAVELLLPGDVTDDGTVVDCVGDGTACIVTYRPYKVVRYEDRKQPVEVNKPK